MTKIACGIDCGGTNLKMFCNIKGNEYYSTIPTGDDFTRRDLIHYVTDFVESLPVHVGAIGIAFSGLGSSTHIHTTIRNYLVDLDVKYFSHLGCRVAFINDANATAMCGLNEYPESKVLVGVTNGTGIGSGICIDGKLFTGARGYAGEINGNIIPINGYTKMTTICSGSVLQKALENASELEKDRLINESASNFACLLTHVINLLNPDVIYLSGGTFNYLNYFDIVRQKLDEIAYDFMMDDIKVVLSKYPDTSGCIGAAKYVLDLI